jgi:hypothetical protein
MPVAAPLIIAGGAIAGGVIASKGASSAARAQQQAADAATAEQRRQYDQTREDQTPFRDAGVNALGQLTKLNAGDYSSFTTSPDYQFTRSEGNRDIGNSFAARGGAASGNALKALAEFNAGLASRNYDNYYNKIAGVAGVGQNATNQIQQAGTNATNNISNNLIGAGDARASGIVGSANAWSSALGQVAGGIGDWWGTKYGGDKLGYINRLQSSPTWRPSR